MVDKKILDQIHAEANQLVVGNNSLEKIVADFVVGIPDSIANKLEYYGVQRVKITNTFEGIDSFLGKNALVLLHLSAIQGEYYNSQASQTLEQILEVKKQVKKYLHRLADTTNTELKKNDAAERKEIDPSKKADYLRLRFRLNTIKTDSERLLSVADEFSKWISHYTYLANHVHARMNDQMEVRDFNLEEELNHLNNSTNVIQSRTNSAYHIFLINIKLCEIDEGFDCGKQTLDTLLELSSKIKFYEQDSKTIVRKILDQKCDFIILKILRRWVKHNPEQKHSVFIDSERQNYSIDDLKAEERTGLFNSFSTKAFTHYADSDNTFNISSKRYSEKINDLKLNPNNIVTSEDIHFLCKFSLKNVAALLSNEHPNLSFTEVFAVMQSLERQVEKELKNNAPDKKYDGYSYESSLHLCANALLRLKAEEFLSKFTEIGDAESTFSKIQLLWKDLLKKQARVVEMRKHTPTICAIAPKTYCEVLLKLREKFSELSETTTEMLENYERLIDDFLKEYTNAIDYYRDVLQSSEKSKLLPFYLRTEECFIPIEKSELAEDERDLDVFKNFEKIFLDSSYVLPTDYRYLYSQMDSWIPRLRLSELKLYHLIYQSKVAGFDNKFKEQQYSIITVIGLYAGFITYVLSTVSIVPKLERSYMAMFLFLLIYACSLSLFVLLLKLVFKSSSEKLSISDLFSFTGGFRNWKINTSAIFISLLAALLLFAALGVNKYSDMKVPSFNSSSKVIYKTIYITKDSAKINIDTLSSSISIDSSFKE